MDDFTINFFDFSEHHARRVAPVLIPRRRRGQSDRRRDVKFILLFNTIVYSFATIPDAALAPGRYLLSIYNDTSDDPGDDFFWSADFIGGDGNYAKFAPDQPYVELVNTIVQDFTLLGSDTPTPSPVPEPSSVVMLSTGAFALLGYGWRRRRVKRA